MGFFLLCTIHSGLFHWMRPDASDENQASLERGIIFTKNKILSMGGGGGGISPNVSFPSPSKKVSVEPKVIMVLELIFFLNQFFILCL